MKKLLFGLILSVAVVFGASSAFADYTVTEETDVNISDNQVVIVQCIQNGVSTQTTVVEGSDEVDETPQVEAVEQSFEQKNCIVNIYIKSDVDVTPTVTPTAAPTSTPTATAAPTATPTERVVERVVERTVEVTVPEEAPVSGFAR